MNRTAALLLFVVALPSLACDPPSEAATPTAPAPAAPPAVAVAPPAPVAPPRPTFLYEVGPEATPSYVFGELVGGSTLRESFPPEYEAIFRYARVLVAQSGQTDAEQGAWLLAQMRRAPPLSGSLAPPVLAQLTEQIGDQLPAEMVIHLTPELALTVLQLEVLADAHGGDARRETLVASHELVARRQTLGSAVVSLDAPRDVERQLARMRSAGAAAAVADTLAHLDEQRALVRVLLDHYQRGDEAALLAAFRTPSPEMAEFEASMRRVGFDALDRWMPTIEREIAAGNALVVLPVELVLGDDGALARLRTSGVPVRRVVIEAPTE